MGIKLGSVVFVLVFFFVAKISYETVFSTKKKTTPDLNYRSSASIDQSYLDHLAKR